MQIINNIIGWSIVTLSLLVVASGCGANNEKKSAGSDQASLVSDKKEESTKSIKESESSQAKIDREVTIDKLNEVQTTNDLAIKVTNADLLDATELFN